MQRPKAGIGEVPRSKGKTDAEAQRAYEEIVAATLPEGLTSYISTQGAIKTVCKIMHGNQYMYSAIPNQKWVLWYFRHSAMKWGFIEREATIEKFPTCNATETGHLRLRLLSTEDAREVLAWIGASPKT